MGAERHRGPRQSSAMTTPADPRDWITPEDLNVAPALLGLPLASPWQRAKAMVVDATLVLTISHFGNTVLLAGCAWLALRLYRRQRVSRGEVLRDNGRLGWAPVLCLIAFGLYTSAMETFDEPTRAARREAVASASTDPHERPHAAGGTAASSPDANVDVDVDVDSRRRSRARIQELEAEVHQLKEEAKRTPLEKARHWWELVGLNLAWAFAYFVAFPLIWAGRTPGKRLMGLRVVELTGKPLTTMLCVRRYGGYAAGATTGGMGFLQILWDANRQGLHDKAAHTAVIDARNPSRLTAWD